MLATTRLLFTELSSNLGSTLRAAATGSPAAAAHTRSQDKYSRASPFTFLFCCFEKLSSAGKSMNFPDRLKRCTGAISADVCTADIFGPIIGSIRPEILERFYFISRDFYTPSKTNVIETTCSEINSLGNMTLIWVQLWMKMTGSEIKQLGSGLYFQWTQLKLFNSFKRYIHTVQKKSFDS